MASRTVASVGTREYDELLRLLRETRESAGLSQEALSHLLGKSRTFIGKIEAGSRRVDVIELFAIVKLLDVKPLTFMKELHDRLERF